MEHSILDRGCVCPLSPYISRYDQHFWASQSSSKLAVRLRVEGFGDFAEPLHFIPRECWLGLEDCAAAQVKSIANLSDPLEVRDNVHCRQLNS